MTGLLDHHAEQLRASAISDEIAEARGYFSASRKTELAALGFATYQAIVPTLVVPVWGVGGEIVNYQHRPDRPRIDAKRDRLVKYETVAGSSVRLDVPPSCRALIGDPRAPLWITEGSKKADALASAGACAVSVLGVDCINCPEDLDRISLDERKVLLAFDSDVMVKRSVHGALERAAKLLSSRGAVVLFVYLPTTWEGRVGVDDWLARGGTVEQLYAIAEDVLRELPPEPKPKRAVGLPTAQLLAKIYAVYRRFLWFRSQHEPVALSLWVMHTYVMEAANATPYPLVDSPEKESGKTRVLEVTEQVAKHARLASNITAAGLFQAIEKWQPTLLVDEADALFHHGRVSDQAEDLRRVLNAGNRRSSYVIRGSQEGEPREFATWGPKMIAGINNGRLPDTIRSRGFRIAMQKLRNGETVADFYPTDPVLLGQLGELRELIEDWAQENLEWLTAWRRQGRVTGISDRLQEAWDPLLAIADLAGGEWAAAAPEAASELARVARELAEDNHGHLLLEALWKIFNEPDDRGVLLDKIFSEDLCPKLNAEEELPFGDYGSGPKDSRGISPIKLAALLRPYKIRPEQIRIGPRTAKGYRSEWFADVWERYAHTPDNHPVGNPKHPKHGKHSSADADFDVSGVSGVSGGEQADSGARVSANGAEQMDIEECVTDAERESEEAS